MSTTSFRLIYQYYSDAASLQLLYIYSDDVSIQIPIPILHFNSCPKSINQTIFFVSDESLTN